jgi:hypothetical protein
MVNKYLSPRFTFVMNVGVGRSAVFSLTPLYSAAVISVAVSTVFIVLAPFVFPVLRAGVVPVGCYA